MFEIIFKPNGFYKLFKIPLNKILNKIIDAEDIFNSKVNAFFEQTILLQAIAWNDCID